MFLLWAIFWAVIFSMAIGIYDGQKDVAEYRNIQSRLDRYVGRAQQ